MSFISQTISVGHDAERLFQTALSRLGKENVVARIWDKDSTIWSQEPAEQKAIQNRLGWFRVPRLMAQETKTLHGFAQEVRKAGFTHALLLGMGGSGLFSEVCRNTFGIADGYLSLKVLDTTDATAIRSQVEGCKLEHLCVIVSSKSGTTSEVRALAAYFYDLFKGLGGNPGEHCVAITDLGTPLEKEAKAKGYLRTFVHGPENGMDVGGRFSALTYFGLVPAALMGVNLDMLLKSATAMLDACGRSIAIHENPAAQLAAAIGSLSLSGRDKITLLASKPLASFGTWVEQLLAESLGKSGKGLVPIIGEPMQDVHTYARDRVFIELQLSSEPDEALNRCTQALIEAGYPVIRVHWQDRYDLGGEIVKWSVATAIAGGLIGINPFDEPNVRESKDRTSALLSSYTDKGRLPAEKPLFSEGNLSVYGKLDLGAFPSSLEGCLGAFLKNRRSDDYIAVLSFLPRISVLDEGIVSIRQRIANELRCATVLGFGPRYLHSTGQLFKGGPDAGLFFLITADEDVDLPVPGEQFTFKVLKQAQALGDFQAMQQKERRVLRLHLGGDLEQTLKQLARALSEAAALAGSTHSR